MPTAPRKIPTPAEIQARQRADAERDRAQKAATVAAAHARVESTAVTPVTKPALPAEMPPDSRAPLDRYLDEIASAQLPGRVVKFAGKDGKFVYTDDGTEIGDDVDATFLDDQVMVAMLRFHGKGVPPDRIAGLLSDGFVPPSRESLGDNDPSAWELGLDGRPQDPWVHQIAIALQRSDTGELITFVTSSTTGRRAVGSLIKHANRLHQSHPDMYAVVRLKAGGFNHRDERVGWVPVPVFAVVGRTPRDSAAKPDTSPAADYSDEIPF
jgi:hypothetical protein